jgi:hypothetical protein
MVNLRTIRIFSYQLIPNLHQSEPEQIGSFPLQRIFNPFVIGRQTGSPNPVDGACFGCFAANICCKISPSPKSLAFR